MTALERLKLRLSDDDAQYSDAVLTDSLESAKAAILARRYPVGEFPEELPNRYADLQVRIAVVLISQRGAEGEVSHSENGVTRTWEGLDGLLSEVVPVARVFEVRRNA